MKKVVIAAAAAALCVLCGAVPVGATGTAGKTYSVQGHASLAVAQTPPGKGPSPDIVADPGSGGGGLVCDLSAALNTVTSQGQTIASASGWISNCNQMAKILEIRVCVQHYWLGQWIDVACSPDYNTYKTMRDAYDETGPSNPTFACFSGDLVRAKSYGRITDYSGHSSADTYAVPANGFSCG
jgi:hypothetical protein